MRKDIESNPNIRHLDTVTVPSEFYLGGKMDIYRCRTRSGLWRVTTSTEYDEGYKCWFERLVMSPWNRKTKKVPTWEEILAVKREFFGPEEECIHFIPRESEYVNIKPDCMHIFHPLFDKEEI